MELSPNQSTNSSNCWTSGLAMVESPSLVEMDLADFLTTPMLSPMANTSLPLIQKSSGLFDNDFAGIKTKPASLDNDNDMYEEFGDKEEFGNMEGDILDMLDAMGPEQTLSEDSFLNNVMDLTSFLLPEPEAEPEQVQPCITVNLDDLAQSTQSLKRKRETEERSPSVEIDHDYVSKKSRRTPSLEASSGSLDFEVDADSADEASTSRPTSMKTVQKYRERRMKNNIASKRSREIRKKKFSGMEEEAERLTEANKKLRIKIEELEKLAKEMKNDLIKKLAGKK